MKVEDIFDTYFNVGDFLKVTAWQEVNAHVCYYLFGSNNRLKWQSFIQASLYNDKYVNQTEIYGWHVLNHESYNESLWNRYIDIRKHNQ